MKGTLRSIRLPAVVLLFLCTLPSQVNAQQFVCWPIASGDTASSLARRLTGSAAAAYGLAFQIRDPARRMFVPKSHYQRLQSDWQACVAPGPVVNTPPAHAPDVELASSTIAPDEPLIASVPQALASVPLTVVRTGWTSYDFPHAGSIGGALLLIVLLSVAGSMVRRPIPPDVRRVGENFIAVFVRPLRDESSPVPPIEARMRFRRRKQHLEISIAPTPGHRYPNLADHKKNVEYDVDRVMAVLGDYALTRPLHARGRWVVVSIRCNGGNDEN